MRKVIYQLFVRHFSNFNTGGVPWGTREENGCGSFAAVTDAALVDILYETVSATATVGLSRGLTARLDLWGKLIVIATMYFGRIGPISLAIALGTRKEERNSVTDPIEEISVG